MANWAEMDKTDEPGNKCQIHAMNLINPHIEKATSHVTRFQPGISKASPLTEDVIRVLFYDLSPTQGYKMMEVVKEVEKIRKAADTETPDYWYQWQTSGLESPSFHHVMPYKDFAAIDIVQEVVWETVEKSAGKAKRDELQATFRSSLQNTWNYVYKLDKGLSRPSK